MHCKVRIFLYDYLEIYSQGVAVKLVEYLFNVLFVIRFHTAIHECNLEVKHLFIPLADLDPFIGPFDVHVLIM